MNDPITLHRDSAFFVCYAIQSGLCNLAYHADQGGFIPTDIGDNRRQNAIAFLSDLHERILKSCLKNYPDESIIVQTVTVDFCSHQPE
jgi:hypothetical protein